ncbi:hypothetical protein PGH07_07905 [Sulfurovum sp. zt1-1]|uniref:PH domain-containing protein n=1 Tax=Sulfurovum zhangzhouensis TaxID=3019067 RepID=A0ABT7QZ98_9BACT|nr:hypothetical protein [Sulfurovum zhangzhouensis]MDM5272101.1 hypothetical protein [Sulfurovum zhangzhouensis]
MGKNQIDHIDQARDIHNGDNIHNTIHEHKDSVSPIGGMKMTVKWRLPALIAIGSAIGIFLYMLFYAPGQFHDEIILISSWFGTKDTETIVMFYLLFAFLVYSIAMPISFMMLDKVLSHPYFDLHYDGKSIKEGKYTYDFVRIIWKIEVTGWRQNVVECYCLPEREYGNPYLVKFVMKNKAVAHYLRDSFYTYKAEMIQRANYEQS